MDFLSLETDNKGVKDVLVMTDHFTKYAIAVSTKNQTAKVVAEAFGTILFPTMNGLLDSTVTKVGIVQDGWDCEIQDNTLSPTG